MHDLHQQSQLRRQNSGSITIPCPQAETFWIVLMLMPF
jgi:hypothetical protein